MKEKTVNELPGTPSLYKEVLRSDWDNAQATIEQQAREIERLSREANNDAIAYRAVLERQNELRSELAALRAQQPDVVLPERKPASVRYGYRELGASEGWNACLDEVARLNSSPVSAGGVDERAAFEIAARQHIKSNPDDWVLLDGLEGEGHWAFWGWMARAALPASAQSVPDGWKLVPVEPTSKMLVHGSESLRCDCELERRPHAKTATRAARNLYANMLAAAPAPGKGGDSV